VYEKFFADLAVVSIGVLFRAVRNNDNQKSHKYVCITTYQPDNKSRPNPTKQHAIVNTELNIVTCPTYPDKLIRDNVVAPSVPTSVVTVALPISRAFTHASSRFGPETFLRLSAASLAVDFHFVARTHRSLDW